MDIGFLAQIAIFIIVIAVLFIIVSKFVPIDARVASIIWLVIAAVIAIVLIEWLVGFAGSGHIGFHNR